MNTLKWTHWSEQHICKRLPSVFLLISHSTISFSRRPVIVEQPEADQVDWKWQIEGAHVWNDRLAFIVTYLNLRFLSWNSACVDYSNEDAYPKLIRETISTWQEAFRCLRQAFALNRRFSYTGVLHGSSVSCLACSMIVGWVSSSGSRWMWSLRCNRWIETSRRLLKV